MKLAKHGFATLLIAAAWLMPSKKAEADWAPGGVQLSSIGWLDNLVACPDLDGGAYGAWSDVPGKASFVQHVTSDGAIHPAWPATGKPLPFPPAAARIPKLAPDGSGGVYIACYRSIGSRDQLRLLRWSADGTTAAGWPDSGIVVSITDPASTQAIEPDSAGGLYIAWSSADSTQADIDLVRLDATGQPMSGWPAGGVAVATDPMSERFPRLCRASDGGVYLLHIREVDVGGGYTAANNFLHRWSTSGERLWPVDGILLHDPITSLVSYAYGTSEQSMAARPDGGVDVALAVLWYSRNSTNRVIVRRYSPSGTRLWTYVPHYPWPTNAPLASAAGDDQLVFAVQDIGRAIVGRVAADGTPAPGWTENVSLPAAGRIGLVGGSFDASIVVVAGPGSTSGTYAVRGWRYSRFAQPDPGIPDEGQILGEGQGEMLHLRSFTDASGGAIAVWMGGTPLERSVHAARLSFPEPIRPLLLAVRPDPNGIAIEYEGGPEEGPLQLERGSATSDWAVLLNSIPHLGGTHTVVDTSGEGGVRYGYRLAYGVGAERWTSPDLWETFPVLYADLRAVRVDDPDDREVEIEYAPGNWNPALELERRLDAGAWSVLVDSLSVDEPVEVVRDSLLGSFVTYGYRLAQGTGAERWTGPELSLTTPPDRPRFVDVRQAGAAVAIEYFSGDPRFGLRLDKRSTTTGWYLGNSSLPQDEPSQVWNDSLVLAGVSYGYRLVHGSGAQQWMSSETWVTVSSDTSGPEPPPPSTLALAGAVPNPAHGAASVSFALVGDAPATLSAFDLRGRRVWSQTLSGAGPHVVVIGGTEGWAPGIYVLKLEQAGDVRTSRMVVLP